MEQKKKLLGYYNYTVILTYIGMLSGFLGVVNAYEGKSLNAVICLMVAGLCDMFDGAIASTKKNRTEPEKCFGIQIDSLSDLICFGMLPASIVYSVNSGNRLVLVISALYVLSALIRLAYFNVDEQERQKKCTGSREVYFGLPVTVSALLIPMVYGLIGLFSAAQYTALTVTLLITGVLFLLPFPLKKAHSLGKACVILVGVVEIVIVCLSV